MMRLSAGLRRFRWPVLTGWLVAVLAAGYLAATHSGQLTGGGFEVDGSQSLHVQYQLQDHYPEEGASPLALVAAPRADASYQNMNDAAALLDRVARETPSLTVVPTPQPPPRPDRPYVVSLRLSFHNTGAVDVAKQLRAKLGISGDRPGQFANGTVRLHVIGQGALGAAASAKTKHDVAAAERWNLPVVLAVLLAVFGSLAAAAVPLALGVGTVIITMGLVYLLASFTMMSVFVTSTVSMFGIALAIDYSLFIVMRYREELRAGRQHRDAIDSAMATSGLAVVLSGLTVIASLTGIYLIKTPVLVSMATGAILAVAVAVLTSATLTPAVLATFSRSVARQSPLLRWSHRPQQARSEFWTRWTGRVMRRPWLSALAAAVFLGVLAAPAFSLVLGNSMMRQFNAAHEMRGGVGAAAQALGPGALGPVRVLVGFAGGDASAPDHEPELAAIRDTIGRAPNVIAGSVSAPVFADDNSSALLSAVLSVDPEDMKARETIGWLRSQLPETGQHSARPAVGGPTALIKDFDDRVSATEPLVLVFVTLIAFVMLLIAIQSVLLAFKGVLMTVLSVAAAYGSLVVVFQWGWLQRLGFEPISSIDSFIPPIVLAMTFGLSMDYEIFLLARIRERFLLSGNTRDAVSHGVSTSARTITSAALIMIAVFVGFAFAGMPLVAELGVACAVAIAVDATVVRLVMVPALMVVFDRWNWWLPRWLGWLLPSVDFEKPLPAVDAGDVVVITDDLPALTTRGADLRVMVKSSARLKRLAPDAVCVADPLALRGCGSAEALTKPSPVITAGAVGNGHPGGPDPARSPGRNGRDGLGPAGDAAHPITVWRGWLSVALDALGDARRDDDPLFARSNPVETVTVQLPTGDRLQIPTGAETLRLKGYLIAARNSHRDYAGFADLVDMFDPQTAAAALAAMDGYYAGQPTGPQSIATELARRLADPRPADLDGGYDPNPGSEWDSVRRRCLSVAVAMLEEAR